MLTGANLLVEGGKIACVGASCFSDSAERVDCQGGWLTPGIVDIHSHLGVNSYPSDWQGKADTNENFASGIGGIQSMVLLRVSFATGFYPMPQPSLAAWG